MVELAVIAPVSQWTKKNATYIVMWQKWSEFCDHLGPAIWRPQRHPGPAASPSATSPSFGPHQDDKCIFQAFSWVPETRMHNFVGHLSTKCTKHHTVCTSWKRVTRRFSLHGHLTFDCLIISWTNHKYHRGWLYWLIIHQNQLKTLSDPSAS